MPGFRYPLAQMAEQIETIHYITHNDLRSGGHDYYIIGTTTTTFRDDVNEGARERERERRGDSSCSVHLPSDFHRIANLTDVGG